AFRGDDGCVMRESIEECGRELLVAGKDADPFGKGEIRRDDGRAPLVAVGEEIEEELATMSIERDKTELVDNQHVDPQQPLLQAGQPARATGPRRRAARGAPA